MGCFHDLYPRYTVVNHTQRKTVVHLSHRKQMNQKCKFRVYVRLAGKKFCKGGFEILSLLGVFVRPCTDILVLLAINISEIKKNELKIWFILRPEEVPAFFRHFALCS